MSTNIVFDDVARNLLVYLKGQVPSLANKTNRDEIVRQVQSITFTLRSSIVQLESATYGASGDNAKLAQDLEDLQRQKENLEERLEKEKNISRDLRNKLNDIHDSIDDETEKSSNLTEALHKQKIEVERLKKENEILKSQSDKFMADYDALKERAESVPIVATIDDTALNDTKRQLRTIKNQLADAEALVDEVRTDNANLKRSLQNREIELQNIKESIENSANMDKAEAERLNQRLKELENTDKENSDLKENIAKLKFELAQVPSQREYESIVSSMKSRITFLEDSLVKSQTTLQETQAKLNGNGANSIVQQKLAAEQKVLTLEATLKNIIAAREAEIEKASKNFTFNPEDCVFLFQTLSSTVKRLESSLENKDVYKRSKESIAILEKAKAVTKISTVGQQLDKNFHKVTKAFRADFLPDEMVIFEESPGFASGDKVIQKAVVWIAKSNFVCSECGKASKVHELFCPQCGYELTAPDGTSKRDMPCYPNNLDISLPLLDELMKQGNIKASGALMNLVAKVSPNNPELMKKQAILSRVDPNFSPYSQY